MPDNPTQQLSPEIALNRLKYQDSRQKSQTSESPTNNLADDSTTQTKKGDNLSAGQAISGLKNIAKKASQDKNKETAKEMAQVGAKETTKAWLSIFWGSVWLDWTLLSLLYLNGHLVASIFLPNVVCQFGEDHLIGKWFPDKEWAKWTEIILLMILNAIVATVLFMIFYIIYKVVSGSLIGMAWDWLWGGYGGVIEGAIKN